MRCSGRLSLCISYRAAFVLKVHLSVSLTRKGIVLEESLPLKTGSAILEGHPLQCVSALAVLFWKVVFRWSLTWAAFVLKIDSVSHTGQCFSEGCLKSSYSVVLEGRLSAQVSLQETLFT